jgi:archaellum component FlaC
MTRVKRSDIIYPTLEDFEQVVDLLISINEEFTEDIPPFKTRYSGKLESIIEQIQYEVFGQELYKGIVDKASGCFIV